MVWLSVLFQFELGKCFNRRCEYRALFYLTSVSTKWFNIRGTVNRGPADSGKKNERGPQIIFLDMQAL